MFDLRAAGHPPEQDMPAVPLQDSFGKVHEGLVDIMVWNSSADPVQISRSHNASSSRVSRRQRDLAGKVPRNNYYPAFQVA
ncbi:hypothetical protein [Paracoccus sp. (in: a-proteobacteria)]|uniref:hypothetical protein n=1 Tax=Paracoccus sp. TaxID=267 RepID=UPI00396CD707